MSICDCRRSGRHHLVSLVLEFPKKHWIRFSLRTLLLLVTVLAIWLGLQVQRAQNQRSAVRMIQQLGGSVEYDYQYRGNLFVDDAQPSAPKWLRKWIGDDFFVNVVVVHLSNTTADNSDLKSLSHLKLLKRLYLAETSVTGQGLELLARCNQLEALNLSGTRVNDDDMTLISGFSNIRWLNVQGTSITDKSLQHIGALMRLEFLCLDGTDMTDAGLVYLSQLVNLRQLFFSDTQVTGRELKHLAELHELEYLLLPRRCRIEDDHLVLFYGLTKLKKVNLKGADVSSEGLSKLQESLPACRF